jgi:hypothetical protein
MTQLSASTMPYQQMVHKVGQLITAINSASLITKDEIAEQYINILNEIKNQIGAPLASYSPFIKGEPPRSEKFNKFFAEYAQDVSVLSKQIDYLNAKTISVFNLFSKEIEGEKRYSERIASKCKILQMYSRSPSDDLIYIGDSFENDDLIDYTKIAKGSNPLIRGGIASFAIESSKRWVPDAIEVVSGNGFIGNSHQVVKANNDENTSEYKYVFENNKTLNNLRSIVDNNPLSYFEYENINVDKSTARPPLTTIAQENEFKFLKTEMNSSNANESNTIDWSSHPESEPLTLKLKLTSNSGRIANSIDITPFFGSSKYVEVTEVLVFAKDGSSENVLKNTIFIGSSLVPLNIELAQNYFYNKATVRFPERQVSKIEISFRQPTYSNIDIKHVYWKPSSTNVNNPFVNLSRFNPDALSRDIYESIKYNKYQLIPTLSNPTKYKTTTQNVADINVALKKKPTSLNAYFIAASFVNESATPVNSTVYFNRWKVVGEEAEFISEIIKDEDSYITKNYDAPSAAQEDLNDLLDLYFGATPYVDEELGTLQDISIVQQSFVPIQKEISYRVIVEQEEEFYKAKRWAIGIRDIDVYRETYIDEMQVISFPFKFDYPVESVMLDVQASIDEVHSGRTNIQTYISADQGSNWIEVSPVQLDFTGTPEIVFFNQSILDEYRLSGASYLSFPTIPKEVKDITVKIVAQKKGAYNFTPNIYSYQLIAKVKRS